MKYVNVDPDQILENRFTSEDLKFYLRSLVPAVGILLIMLVMTVFLGYLQGEVSVRMITMVIMILILFGGCAYKIISTRVKNNKRLKAIVDKFGRDNLAMDLRDPNNEVYMLHPEKYETYIIVSSRYLYFAKEAVFALDDIKQAYIEFNDSTHQNKAGDSNIRPYDHSRKDVKETVRFIKPAYITTMDGKTDRRLVALEQDQMYQLNEFFATLSK